MKEQVKLALEYIDRMSKLKPLSLNDSVGWAYLAGFEKAKEMAADFLGPPWPFANLTIPSNEITWDREGMKLIKKELMELGEQEVKE